MIELSAKYREIISHAIGVDQYGSYLHPGGVNRNFYGTLADSPDGRLCEMLVAYGLMTRDPSYPSDLFGGEELYRVTHAGSQLFFAGCPQPPKQTAGQKRYQDYLDADVGWTFGEWLKRRKQFEC